MDKNVEVNLTKVVTNLVDTARFVVLLWDDAPDYFRILAGAVDEKTEQMVTRALTHPGAPGGKKKAAPRDLDVHTRAAQDKLRLTFGTKVDIARKGKGGEIRIAFKNEDELIRIYEILVGE